MFVYSFKYSLCKIFCVFLLARPENLHSELEPEEGEICSAYQILSPGKYSKLCEFSAGFGMHISVCRYAEINFQEVFVTFLVSWIKTWSIRDIHKDFYKSQCNAEDKLDTSATDQILENSVLLESLKD